MSYQYSTNMYSTEEVQKIYAFDIKITYIDNEIIKKKIITIDKVGEIFECKNNIKKFKVVVCSINSDNIESIILKKQFDNKINDTIVLYKKNIIIYLSKNLDNISINYQIN